MHSFDNPNGEHTMILARKMPIGNATFTGAELVAQRAPTQVSATHALISGRGGIDTTHALIAVVVVRLVGCLS